MWWMTDSYGLHICAMFDLDVRNLAEVFDQIDAWEAEVNAMAVKYCKGIAVSIFSSVVNKSVQYSGDFAANWKYSLNEVDTSFTPNAVRGLSFATLFKPIDEVGGGDSLRAVRYAIGNARGNDDAFKLGDTIYISNSAEHDEPYAMGIEDGTIKLRMKQNAEPLGRAIREVMNWVASGSGASILDGIYYVDASGYTKATRVTQIDSLRRRFKHV